jgi:D-3-phosphoglycerate dehydrogenase
MNVLMTAPRLAPEAVALLEAAGARIHYMDPFPGAAAVAARAGAVDAVAILSRQGPVEAAAMDAAPNLRIIARHGVGVDDVDMAEAERRGILVTRSPGSNTRAVAEHTLALILALAKDLPRLSAGVAAGGWRGAATTVRDIRGLRLGLVGCGGIGQAVAHLAAGFGMEVAAYTPSGRDRPGIRRAPDLHTLLASSDVLSLHLPLLPSTRGLIGPAELALLPRGAILVNTSRGGLVDEAALLEALDRGQVSAAGLDVTAPEPPAPDDPLRRHPGVLLTPHVAGVTADSLVAMGVMAAECIAAVLQGRPVPPDRLVRL